MEKDLQAAFSLRHKIIGNKQNYFETIKKTDTPVLHRLMRDDTFAEGSVIRFVFGASEVLPARSVTAAISASELARLVPCNQVQIVSASSIGERVNNVSAEKSLEQFERFARLTRHIIGHLMPDIAEKLVFGRDHPDVDVERFVPVIERALQSPDIGHARQILEKQAGRRQAEFVTYTASHLALQETATFTPKLLFDAKPIEPTVITSVGGQAERNFYEVRARARDFVDEGVLIPSIQVFTHHNPPPYFMARGGEQTIDDAIRTRSFDLNPADTLARRDMQHFARFLTRQGGGHE